MDVSRSEEDEKAIIELMKIIDFVDGEKDVEEVEKKKVVGDFFDLLKTLTTKGETSILKIAKRPRDRIGEKEEECWNFYNEAAGLLIPPFYLKSSLLLLEGKIFVIGKTIDSGSFGVVKKITDLADIDKNNVIKILHISDKEEELAKTLVEFENLQKFSPALNPEVGIRDTESQKKGEDKTKKVYIKMEEGKTLNEFVLENKTLTNIEIMGHLLKIAHTLKAMHADNKVHMDMKPNNALVTGSGSTAISHVIDMGSIATVGERKTVEVVISGPQFADICTTKHNQAAECFEKSSTFAASLKKWKEENPESNEKDYPGLQFICKPEIDLYGFGFTILKIQQLLSTDPDRVCSSLPENILRLAKRAVLLSNYSTYDKVDNPVTSRNPQSKAWERPELIEFIDALERNIITQLSIEQSKIKPSKDYSSSSEEDGLSDSSTSKEQKKRPTKKEFISQFDKFLNDDKKKQKETSTQKDSLHDSSISTETDKRPTKK